MTTFLNLFRRTNPERDAMRESTALTTVYLLELNQKFEGYMRRKVEELEGRVAAQQARQRAVNLADDATRPVAVAAAEVETDDSYAFDTPESLVEPLGVVPDRPAERLEPEVEPGTAEPPTEPADYLSLLGGTSSSDSDAAPLETWDDRPELPGELIERDLDLADGDGDEWDTTLTDDGEDWA